MEAARKEVHTRLSILKAVDGRERMAIQRNASLMAGLAAKEADHARVESELKTIADGILHSKEKLEENRRELENLRAEKANRDDRNRKGIDLQMKMANITEDLWEKGATEGLSDAQIKNLVGSSLAEIMNMSYEELTTRLNNKEKVAPAPFAEEEKTDAETKEYLQRAEDVNKAVEEQEKVEAECKRLTE